MDFLNPAANPTGFTLFIVLFTTATIVGSLVWRARWSSTLGTGGMRGGTPGTAVITGMGQTGMMVNNLPQLTFELQVQLPGQLPYQADVRQTVPHAVLGMLAPGRTVAVVVDPNKPAKVKIDFQGTANLSAVAAVPGASSYAMAGAPAPVAPPPVPGAPMAPMAGAQVRSNDELVATGEVVAATVVAVQDTGQFFGPDPIVLLTVDVHAPTGGYQVQVGHRVPTDRRPRLVPGTVLRAHLDPVDRNALGIDWRCL